MSYPPFTSIHGRRLGLTGDGSLVGNDIQITSPAVDAEITVGAEVTNVRPITVQLKDANGDPITYVAGVELWMFANAARTAFVATGGSTGIAIGTDGALLPIVAKKLFAATTEADGALDLTWTDTGTEAAYLGVRLPNGEFVMSDALTNT